MKTAVILALLATLVVVFVARAEDKTTVIVVPSYRFESYVPPPQPYQPQEYGLRSQWAIQNSTTITPRVGEMPVITREYRYGTVTGTTQRRW